MLVGDALTDIIYSPRQVKLVFQFFCVINTVQFVISETSASFD